MLIHQYITIQSFSSDELNNKAKKISEMDIRSIRNPLSE